MLENDPLAMKRPMNAKAVTAPFCSKKILNAFPLKKVNNCREYQNITLVMKVCEVAKMTKNRSVKNCAWMEHSNAIFALGDAEYEFERLNFQKFKCRGVAWGEMLKFRIDRGINRPLSLK